jgi:hypothetical protein
VPSPSTSTRAADAPPTRDANPKTYPADEQGESAEEKKDGVTKSGHYDVRDPNIPFSSFHHHRQCETDNDAESQDTPPITEGHHQAYSIDHIESTHTAAPAHHHQRQHSSCEWRNSRLASSEAQSQAHTPGHHPTDSTPSHNHRSPITYGSNELQAKHIDLWSPPHPPSHQCRHHSALPCRCRRPHCQRAHQAPCLLKPAITRDTPRDLRGSVSGNNWSKYARR